MLRGHIDRLTSAGLFEGWAIDDEAPLRPLAVEILDAAGGRIAAGYAHLYERDEGATRRGSDWAAFRLRASATVASLRGAAFTLRARGRDIANGLRPPVVDRTEPPLDSLEALAASDPTGITDIDRLESCAGVLVAFVASRGVDAFVRAAHVYVLARPIEPAAFVAFRNGVNSGQVTPLGMLRALASSGEFQRDPRRLAAPNSDGFPFAGR